MKLSCASVQTVAYRTPSTPEERDAAVEWLVDVRRWWLAVSGMSGLVRNGLIWIAGGLAAWSVVTGKLFEWIASRLPVPPV